MLTAKTNLGSFTLPSAWFEITLKQFASLYEKRITDEEGRVSFNEYDAARTLVSDVSVYNQADAGEIEHLVKSWLATLGPMPDWLMEEAPFTIAGVRPPTDIGACTQLQVESAKMIVSDMLEEQDVVDYILLAVPMVAIFLYPLLANKPLTDTDQIEEVIPIIEALPVTEGLPLAAFFLLNLHNLNRTMRLSFNVAYPKPSLKSRLMTKFRNWLNSRKWRRSAP